MTVRLYRDDPWLLEFDARVENVEVAGDHWEIELDQSAFFPEGGGQPADHGSLDDIPVIDVREHGERVLHITTAPLPVNKMVHGRVNSGRRRDFMQQHTGQHVISAAFWKTLSLVTISVHMGTEDTTIDLDTSEITREQLQQVTRLANRIIADDLPLAAVEVPADELGKFNLRKPPPVEGTVRLVQIGDFDCVGCCGLHLPSTGTIRLALCSGWERMRGQVRTHWQIGDRAVAYLEQRLAILEDLRELNATRDEELADAVRRLQETASDLRSRLAQLERRLADRLADELLDAPAHRIHRILENESADMEKSLVKSLLAAASHDFALVNVLPDRLSWSLGLPRGGSVDFRDARQRYLDPLGARGGGRPPLWQGSAPADASPRDLLDALERILQES